MPRASRASRRSGSPAMRALLVLLLAALPLAVAPHAIAHDRLVASSPTDGATLAAVPATVDLTYSDDILPTGLVVEVRDPSGTDRVTGPPSVAGPTVRIPVDPSAPGGAYTVAWRVVSVDGHPIDGAFGFTLALSAPAASPTPANAATPAATPAPAPPAAASTPSAATPTLAPADGGVQVTRLPPLLVLAVALGSIGAVVGATIVAYRRRPPSSPSSPSRPSGPPDA